VLHNSRETAVKAGLPRVSPKFSRNQQRPKDNADKRERAQVHGNEKTKMEQPIGLLGLLRLLGL
jgi:hypothetical protein